jgi:hypothetical protein
MEPTFILAHYSHYNDTLESIHPIFWDMTGKLARVDLNIAAPAYIQTFQGEIIKKIDVTPANKDSLINSF